MNNLQSFLNDPFGFVDSFTLEFKGNNLNIFQKYKKLRKSLLVFASVSFCCWVVFGFDSTPLQFFHVLYEGVPAYIQGTATLNDLVDIYNLYYGKEMHYSAFVIYFGLFYVLSKSWEKAGVTKSKNLVFSFGAMFFSVAVFEFFWMLSYATFQNQSWVITWRFPQAKILIQNTIFLMCGVLSSLYMLTERWFWKGKEMLNRAYYFRAKDIKVFLFVGLSVASALFWIYYPGYVAPLTVELETGETWSNSAMFPQTLYTIDLNPEDSVNAGVWFYLENNLIHATNTIVKLIWAIATFYIFRVKGVKADVGS